MSKIIPDCISDPVKEGLTPITKSLGSSIGNTISVAWELAFGGLDTRLEKVKYKRKKDLESFKEELHSKINKIPKENICEAKMHIIGPTLEASKYYFEEKDLRNIFSSLIASSINKTKTNIVHPCFIEIIKQLSSYDVSLLKLFYPNESLPLAEYVLYIDESRTKCSPIAYNVFLTNSNITNLTWKIQDKNSTTLTNLERLGLIKISFTSMLFDFNYDHYTETPIFNELKKQIKNKSFKAPSPCNLFYNSIDYKPGLVKLTQLGINFLKICLSD